VFSLANALQIDELWDSMCDGAISLTSKALNEVNNAEVLLKIKGVIALFIQTMEVMTLPGFFWCSVADVLKGWGFSVSMLNSFQLTLFYKYAELLKRRFSDDFQEVLLPTKSLRPLAPF
jgi:exocyst complex component 6